MAFLNQVFRVPRIDFDDVMAKRSMESFACALMAEDARRSRFRQGNRAQDRVKKAALFQGLWTFRIYTIVELLQR
jgi:hypothetical protein